MIESFEKKVLKVEKYASLKELFKNISFDDWNAKGWTIDKAVTKMREYYSEEDENKFGVLAIYLS